jgi:hypothetical protein
VDTDSIIGWYGVKKTVSFVQVVYTALKHITLRL